MSHIAEVTMSGLPRTVACPTCQTQSPLTHHRVVSIFECPRCELAFATADESVIETPDFFFDTSQLHFDMQVRIAHQRAALQKRYYESMLGRPLTSILEIGCGYGGWAQAWIALGCNYTGIEFIPEVAQWARDKTGANIITGDFLQVQFNRGFDVIFCSQVLEHVGEPKVFLDRVRELCSLVHIDVPNHSSLTSVIRKLHHRNDYGFIQPPHHLRAYTAQCLKKTLAISQLQVLEVRAVVNTDATWGQLYDTTPIHQVIHSVANILGRGSLLTATARAAA